MNLLGRLLLLALVFTGAPRLRAQSSVFNIYWLDPSDVNSYAEFTRKEYLFATQMGGPKAAAQVLENQKNTVSMIATPTTAQTGSDWWQVQAPTWWKRMTADPVPGASKTGSATQNKGLSELFMGLDSYQRARSTIRAAALMYTSLKGLRFEMDAWQMMKDLLVFQEGQTLTDKNGSPVTVPSGVVSLSIVPKGSEKWRDVVKVFNDEPWDDSNHKIQYIGPTKLSDISIDANEVGGNPSLAPTNAVQDVIARIDAGMEATSETLSGIQMGVDQRRRQALSDALSPVRLANQVKNLNNQMMQAYGSILQLRALLEGRSVQDIQAEYAALQAYSDQEAKAAEAQAFMSAKFYKDKLDEAANVIGELEAPERQHTIALLESDYEGMFNLSSHGTGAITDIDQALKSEAAMINSEFPALVPYVGGIMVPIDLTAVVTGSANAADNDEKNPNSDIQAAFRDAKMRGLAVRFNYELWQELRSARRLVSIEEQVKAANHGLDDDVAAARDMGSALIDQNERAAQLYRFKVANDIFKQWGGTP